MADPEVKVNKYDNSALKQTLDDAIIKYITEELGHQEDHSISNIKLVLGALGCILAVVSHFYPLPFPANKPLLLFCVVCYFCSSGILQYITSYVQQDIILLTKASSPQPAIEVHTSMNKYEPDYTAILNRLPSPRVYAPLAADLLLQ